jgi:hypothetical protein
MTNNEHANVKRLLHSLPLTPARLDTPIVADGSHHERDEQDRIVTENIKARVNDVSWLLPWREWHEG